MEQEIDYQSRTPHINSKNCRTSLYRIKKSFKITSDSPPSSDQKLKINKISLVPLNLENIQINSKLSTEHVLTSPNSKPFWPSTIIKRNEYRIDNFGLFQIPSRNHLKFDDKQKGKGENNYQNIQLKKNVKSEIHSLSTSRNDIRSQFLLQSAKQLDSNMRGQICENMSLGVLKSNRKPLQTSVNESLVELKQTYMNSPHPILPNLQSPKLMFERKKNFQNLNETPKSYNFSRPRQVKKENSIQINEDFKYNHKPMLKNNTRFLHNDQLFVNSTKVFMAK